MNHPLNHLGLMVAIGFSICAIAQTVSNGQHGDLELRLQPEAIRMRIPKAFTIAIVNRSEHEICMPMPSFECGDVAHGSIWLHSTFVAAKPGSANSENMGALRTSPTSQFWIACRPGRRCSPAKA